MALDRPGDRAFHTAPRLGRHAHGGYRRERILQPRIFDSAMVGGPQKSTTFFASTAATGWR
ncbi:hypothetical protein OE699_14030 [Sedimentimonas flavescens]|uniref:Uncharacterized protein n=1 Tax=Sedimentimonas flavescens TaxID=2851012 RepID=A0ABT3A1Z3_9RHOB|nr:hypothetical protein [Sedimentimonas flavescens]MCV2879966.1 hypothetical protein [Sedimentimonas flavescens]